MSCWTAETGRIIASHKADFNCKNVAAKLAGYGGYQAYLKGLGGVFDKYRGKNASVKTAAQLQDVAQYVFGLMAIYGFDYNNGSTYVRWGGGSPFYVDGIKGRCNSGTIDNLCGNNGMAKTTNCNFGMDSLLYKAGLYPCKCTGSDRFKGAVNAGAKVIRKRSDLRVGDLVHFFHSRVTSDDPYTWNGWGHVAIVGEVSGNSVILYDTGNRFIRSGNFKMSFTVNSSNAPTGTYDNYDGWAAVRMFDIKDEVKTVADYAVEVIAGKWGKGEERKKLLGKRYDNVQALVNKFLSPEGHKAYFRAAAAYTLKGYAGNDAARKKFFGKNYSDVQKMVDWTIKTAKEVISGKYGTGEARKKALGLEYDLVQGQVNRMV